MADDLLMRSDFEALATPAASNALKLLFDEGDKDILQFLPELYNVKQTDDPYVPSLSMSGLGLLYRMPEGNRIRLDKFRQGRAKVFLGNVFNLGVGYTRQMRRADRNGAILRQIPVELRKALVQTKEIAGALRYESGFTAQGDEPDGVAWFSTAHPLLRSISGTTTWSNRHSTDAALSYTSLMQARIDMMNNLSDSGRRDPLVASNLTVSPTNERTAWELTNSNLVPNATSTSATMQTQSAVKGLMKLTRSIVNPYFTLRPSAWYLSVPLSQLRVYWYNFGSEDMDTYMDFFTKSYFQDISAEWDYGAVDTRGIYASLGTG